LRIIPVLDILAEKVVHAVAGDRSRYLPVRSIVTDAVSPLGVAADLRRLFSFPEIYVADLDSIERKGSNLTEVLAIQDMDYVVYLDPGVGGAGDMDPSLRRIGRVVVGTETLGSLRELEVICHLHPAVVVSLDFRGEDLVARDRSLSGLDLESLVQGVCQAGASELIFLDLSRVGTDAGIRAERTERIVTASSVPVLVGGGIRDASDIEILAGAGASGVLVATCIHSGRLTKQDIRRLGAR
jgi:phosphoribosylformimino-5-aminoimidazole carboxamide ribotide isomerase